MSKRNTTKLGIDPSTDKYTCHDITREGLRNALIKSAPLTLGFNIGAINARADYILKAIRVGLVRKDCRDRAWETIRNLHMQVEDLP